MRTSIVREGLSFDKANGLVRGLLALASAAMVFAASPTTGDVLTGRTHGTGARNLSMSSEPGFYQWQPLALTAATHLIDYGEAESAWRHALRETETALRVVRAFGSDLVTPEVDSYFREVEAVLGAVPTKLEPRHAEAFAVSLQLARSKFVAEASSFGVWSKLARAIAPAVELRRIPERFVKRAPVEQGTALGWTKADIRVHRAVRDLLAPDADSRSSHA